MRRRDPRSSLRELGSLAARLRRDSPLQPVAPDADVLAWTGIDNDQAVVQLVEADPLSGGVTRFPGLAIDPDAVVLGALVLAGSIERQTEDPDRKERMRRAIAVKVEQLQGALGLDALGPYRLLGSFVAEWPEANKTTLLIELAALDPFAPFQIDWDDDHRNAGLAAIAELIDMTVDDVQRVLDTFVDATRAHREVSLLRVGLYTVAGAAAIGGVGLLAAPMIGTALGGAAGLGGAAATSHGLALIGGMGGTASVSAGTWLVAQAGAVAGAVSAGAGSALFQMGAGQAQAELVKLQVATKLVLVDLQHNDAAAHQIARELKERLQDLEERIQQAMLVNDPESAHVVELRRNAQSLEDASRWVDGHTSDDHGGLQVEVELAADAIAAFQQALAGQSTLKELSAQDRHRVQQEFSASFRVSAGLDRWDVGVAIAAGIIAALVDTFAVATPKTSPVTAELRRHASRSDSWLAKVAKVPFDQSIGDGFTPRTHRVLTPGHDPLLGLVWGTRDILAWDMTRTFRVGGAAVVGSQAPGGGGIDSIAHALLIEIAHLLSDVVTPAGLPLPGWTLLTMNETTAKSAIAAYVRGYDTWHLPAMSLPVLSSKAIIHGYRAIRSAADKEFASIVEADSARIDAMELIALGIASAADLGQLLVGGNPLALNYVQWLTLARRIATEAHERAASVTDVVVEDVMANQAELGNRWALLLGDRDA